MTKLILSILLLCTSAVQASPKLLSDYIGTDVLLTDIRNHQNLWQGYVHRGSDKSYFHALVDNGSVVHWYERNRSIDMAEVGQIADATTTILGVAQGAVESNPLGLGVLPAKYVANKYVESLTYDECKQGKSWLGALGWGPAAANLVTLAAGSMHPGALVVGALAGVWGYQQGAKTGNCELWMGPVVQEQIGAESTVLAIAAVATSTIDQHFASEEMFDF